MNQSQINLRFSTMNILNFYLQDIYLTMLKDIGK